MDAGATSVYCTSLTASVYRCLHPHHSGRICTKSASLRSLPFSTISYPLTKISKLFLSPSLKDSLPLQLKARLLPHHQWGLPITTTITQVEEEL